LKILTALGNSDLYNKIKNVKEINLYEKDILYREGILEILKNNNKINLIIIYEKIPGEISFENLINEIKAINNEIKIIFLLENKNENLEKILGHKNIKNIFYNNQINFEEFILKIKNINYSEKYILEKENKKLKKLILEKEQELNILKNNYKTKNNLINNLKLNFKKEIERKNRLIKIVFISEINYYNFQKIKNEINNKYQNLFQNNLNQIFNIEFLNYKKINQKIKNYENIIFFVNTDLEEIKNLLKIINLIKSKYLIDNKKINILFLENNLINMKILKNIFKNYNILGKINLDKNNNYLINKKLIRNLNKLKNK